MAYTVIMSFFIRVTVFVHSLAHNYAVRSNLSERDTVRMVNLLDDGQVRRKVYKDSIFLKVSFRAFGDVSERLVENREDSAKVLFT